LFDDANDRWWWYAWVVVVIRFRVRRFRRRLFFSRDVSTLYARWVFPKTVIIILGVLLLLRRRRLAFGAATSR
jgi:hypothetical protein|tara:strand:- start:914 stop:1132 length:219 start_codon:yes stop_codon:yes gene_type:complete